MTEPPPAPETRPGSKAGLVGPIVVLVAAGLIKVIGLLVVGAMKPAPDGQGVRGLADYAGSVNNQTIVEATFDVIAIVVGVVGVILLIRAVIVIVRSRARPDSNA